MTFGKLVGDAPVAPAPKAKRKAPGQPRAGMNADGTRTCSACKKALPLDHFPAKPVRPDGSGGGSNGTTCHDCTRARAEAGGSPKMREPGAPTYAQAKQAAKASAVRDVYIRAGLDLTPVVIDKSTALVPVTGTGKNGTVTRADTVRAIQDAAAKMVGLASAAAIEKAIAHANDPASPLHAEYLRLFVDLATPAKAFSAAAEAEVAPGAGSSKAAPTVVFALTVNGVPVGSGQAADAVRVIDVKPVDAVDAEVVDVGEKEEPSFEELLSGVKHGE